MSLTSVDPEAAPRSPAVHERPRLAHLRSLDGLRGIAVLTVVLYHFAPEDVPGGFLGVDVFFVLSGFLITSLLVNEWERNRAISLAGFWVRRARRLLPALFLVLGAVGVYVLLMDNQADAHHVGGDGLATLGYFANWHYISSGQSYVERLAQESPSPLRHTWSLAIEEQFYLLWPLVVSLVGVIVTRAWRRSASAGRHLRPTLTAVCAVLTIVSFVRMITAFDTLDDANRVYYGTDSRAFLILIGSVIGALGAGILTVRWRAARVGIAAGGTVAFGVLAVAMAQLLITDTRLYEGGYGVVAILITLVLVAAAQPGINPLRRLLEARPIVGLGLISYGVYLWHWPVTVWLTSDRTHLDGLALFAVRSAVTLAVSLASYVLIEQPIRRGGLPRWRHVRPVLIPLTTVAMLVALLLVPVVAYPSVNPVPKVAPSRSSREITTGYASVPRCDESANALTKLPPGQRPRVQLFGNSFAAEARDCLREIVNARGGTFQTAVQSGRAVCLILPELRAQVTDPATRPDVAIYFAGTVKVELSCAPEERQWTTQLRAALDIWKAAGTHVYLVPPVPNVPGTAPPPEENDTNSFYYVPPQTPEFLALEASDPSHITVVDAGMFIRDDDGVYQWRMPCLAGGEPGCARDRTVGVRWVDGYHFCTDPLWNGNVCKANSSGGERRVAAAIALQISELGLSSSATPPTEAPKPRRSRADS